MSDITYLKENYVYTEEQTEPLFTYTFDISEEEERENRELEEYINSIITKKYIKYPYGYTEKEHTGFDSSSVKNIYLDSVAECAVLYECYTESIQKKTNDSFQKAINAVQINNICRVNEKISDAVTGFRKINSTINSYMSSNGFMTGLAESMDYYEISDAFMSSASNVCAFSSLFSTSLSTYGNDVVDKSLGALDDITSRAMTAIEIVDNTYNTALKIVDYFSNSKEIAENVGKYLSETFDNFVNSIKTAYENIKKGISDFFSKMSPDSILDSLSNLTIFADIKCVLVAYSMLMENISNANIGLKNITVKGNVLPILASLKTLINTLQMLKRDIDKLIKLIERLKDLYEEKRYLDLINQLLSLGASFLEVMDEYNTQYPYNNSYTTDGGIMFEADNTEGARRIKVTHPSGSSAGVITEKGDISANSKANLQLIANNNIDLSSKESITMTTKYDITEKASGNISISADGSGMFSSIGLCAISGVLGCVVSSKGQININTSNSILMNSEIGSEIKVSNGTLSLTSNNGGALGAVKIISDAVAPKGDIIIKTKGNITLDSGATITLKSLKSIKILSELVEITSGNYTTIKAQNFININPKKKFNLICGSSDIRANGTHKFKASMTQFKSGRVNFS